MLFHLTLVHDAAHCPGYHPELIPTMMESMSKREDLAQSLGVKIHSILNAAPDHVFYAIGEADRPMQMAMFVARLMPLEQAEIRMHAVETIEDTESFIRSMGPPQA